MRQMLATKVAGAGAATEYDPQEEENGRFWITFEDFTQYFSTIFVCRLLDSWRGRHELAAPWGARHGAGGRLNGPTGTDNPQYLVTVTRATNLFVTLTQATYDEEECTFIGMALLQPTRRRAFVKGLASADLKTATSVKTVAPADEAQVALEVLTLEPGEYVLVVCTYYPNLCRDFVLRAYTPEMDSVGVKQLRV